jgi:hypothetical protein
MKKPMHLAESPSIWRQHGIGQKSNHHQYENTIA